MARKMYTGRLAALLGPPPGVLGADNYEEASEGYQQEIQDRFRLLMQHYEIDPSSDSAWRELATQLAQDHVLGLRPWEPTIDTDRHVPIMMRMVFLVRVLGHSEKSAAEALSAIRPELGDAEAVRTIYREQHRHWGLKPILEMFRTIEEAISLEKFEEALAFAIGPDVDLLRQATKPLRGRPPKK